jgi:hypothetical protein
MTISLSPSDTSSTEVNHQQPSVVTVAESRTLHVPDALVPELAQAHRPAGFSVVDTTELRWFVPGPLPPNVRVWFTGLTGVAEKRCDTYLLKGRRDIGMKRRFRGTLELKVRQSLDGRIELDESLAGSLEVWRKWSPAEGLVQEGTDGWWVDVHKSVVKRRFSMDGTEIAFSSDPQVSGGHCCVTRASTGNRFSRSLRPTRATWKHGSMIWSPSK